MCVLISIWEWETVKEYICKIYLFLKRVWLWLFKPDQVIQYVRNAIAIYMLIFYNLIMKKLIFSSDISIFVFLVIIFLCITFSLIHYVYRLTKGQLKMGLCSLFVEVILFFFLNYVTNWYYHDGQALKGTFLGVFVYWGIFYAVLKLSPKDKNK